MTIKHIDQISMIFFETLIERHTKYYKRTYVTLLYKKYFTNFR